MTPLEELAMALIDTSQLQSITDALGLADANLQATLDLNTSTTAAAKVKSVRELIRAQASDTDIDPAVTWQAAIRSLEKSLSNQVNPILGSACRAMEAYYVAQTGQKTRLYFKTFTGWSENFRKLWRRTLNEELVVRLGTITKASGSWGAFTADKDIDLDTELEVRTASLIGNTSISLTLSLSRAAGSNVSVSLTIPANTPNATVFSITGAALRYNGVTSTTVTGGTNGDVLAVWTR
jgi:hypothetical protein